MSSLAAVPDSPLDRLAREVRAEHEAAERAWQSAVQHAHRCGTLLLEAKALCKHGDWLPWLRNVGIPARTATRYMRFAESANLADLPPTITDALEALEDRERREHRERMQKLSAEFDRVMGPPARIPDSEQIRRYRDLVAADTDWALRRLRADIVDFTEVLQATPPPVPPTPETAKAAHRAITRLDHLLTPTAMKRQQRKPLRRNRPLDREKPK